MRTPTFMAGKLTLPSFSCLSDFELWPAIDSEWPKNIKKGITMLRLCFYCFMLWNFFQMVLHTFKSIVTNFYLVFNSGNSGNICATFDRNCKTRWKDSPSYTLMRRLLESGRPLHSKCAASYVVAPLFKVWACFSLIKITFIKSQLSQNYCPNIASWIHIVAFL